MNLRNSEQVDVVICVHNALDHVSACISSVIATIYAPESFRLVIVDDGSAQPTRDFLEEVVRGADATLIRHNEALGYTRAANAGIRAKTARDGFTVLLNSDTRVPPNWLSRMLAIMRKHPDIGVVGPLSNSATWQSVPTLRSGESWAVNQLPEGWSEGRLEEVLVRGVDGQIHARVPLLNGFCMMIRDDVFDRIGLMDETSFPYGYGEENDFCFRATDAGFGVAVALNTYVFHAKTKSYDSETRYELSARGGEALARKYRGERIERAIQTMGGNPILAAARAAIRDMLADGEPPSATAMPFEAARSQEIRDPFRRGETAK